MTWLLKGLSVGTVTFFFLIMLFIIALLFTGTAKAIGTTAISPGRSTTLSTG
jgi:hypothetical protein